MKQDRDAHFIAKNAAGTTVNRWKRALRPVFWPIQGNAPTPPAITN
jgi:hypothetical protein